MAKTKLTGYNKVAVVNYGYASYYFAVYEDGNDYQSGDRVIVSGDSEVKKIAEVISVEAARERSNVNIISEVVAKVTSYDAYEKRVEDRKRAETLRKKMDAEIKKMDESRKYDMYAEQNPVLAEMLAEYRELTKQI